MLSDGRKEIKSNVINFSGKWISRARDENCWCNHWMPSLLLLGFSFSYVFKYYRKLLVKV